MPIVSIGDLIKGLKDLPDICGLEKVLVDNIHHKPANYFDSRVQDRQKIMLVYHDEHGEDALPVHEFIDILTFLVSNHKLTMDCPIFVDEIISLPKPIPINITSMNGAVYLRFVEP